MPFLEKTVRAKKFFTYKGISFYHTYKNDNINEGELQYSFVFNPYDLYEDQSLWVPNLPNWKEIIVSDLKSYVKDIIKEAVDLGYIKKERAAKRTQMGYITETVKIKEQINEFSVDIY